MEKNFKSCIVCFVTQVLSFVVHKQKKASELNHLIKNILEKQFGCKSSICSKKFEEEMNNPMKVVLTIQLMKKSFNVLTFEKSEFLVQNVFFKRMLCH